MDVAWCGVQEVRFGVVQKKCHESNRVFVIDCGEWISS